MSMLPLSLVVCFSTYLSHYILVRSTSSVSGVSRDWMEPLFIHAQCTWLVQSFPNILPRSQAPLVSHCKQRYHQLAATTVPSMISTTMLSNKTKTSNSTKSRDLCVLDLDHTLLSHIAMDIPEKRLLKQRVWSLNNGTDKIGHLSYAGINILRDGTMDLIDILYETSAEVVIYSLGAPAHVILAMIFMEFAYNRYWREHELEDNVRTFRFCGVISTRTKSKSFGVVQMHGYPLEEYDHIMVVDDQHNKVWSDQDPLYQHLRVEHGTKILKVSDGYVFGYTRSPQRSKMSVRNLVESIYEERNSDILAQEFLFNVADTWATIKKISNAEWQQMPPIWMRVCAN